MQVDKKLEKQILELKKLLSLLQKAKTYLEKLAILDLQDQVIEFMSHPNPIQTFFRSLTPEAEYAIKSIIAIGQGPIIFNQNISIKDHFNRLLRLLEQLLEIEIFYQHLGGIIGYHLAVISLIVNKQTAIEHPNNRRYIHPEGLFLNADISLVRQAVRNGIENLNKIAMIYPLGGAGDRLNLTDQKTGTPLPAALLPFLGRTLLEGMIRDLQAYEYLFFKLFGKQLITPIAIMTSVEKNNHVHIMRICKACQWFGRPLESFYFFIQPVVPVMTIEGNWSTSAPLTLNLKPCGHGVLWKLAEEQGVFDWLISNKRSHCAIRQVNNPLAGTDQSLLALIGIGSHERNAFGFVSCERILNSDEGTNVLIETQKEKDFSYCLTNIEYTDFIQKGIDELPAKPGSQYSMFPANTNILFADIATIRKIIKICAIPGLLINMKSQVPYIDSEGRFYQVPGGRLESTMQNIADFIVDHFSHRLTKEEQKDSLRTFIVYNDRQKTISTTKKAFKPGESPLSTPEQACYDILSNHYALLQKCQYQLPDWITIETYLIDGPSCILFFHPGLGPLFSIISQKIRRGKLSYGAELQLEIAEIAIEDLSLEGSLLIEALSSLGRIDEPDLLKYGQEGRCFLKKVTIQNKGINRSVTKNYWKNECVRFEEVKIVLHYGAEFHAENITLKGSHYFEIPANHRLVLKSEPNGHFTEELKPIPKPTWQWHYFFDDDDYVKLEKITIQEP